MSRIILKISGEMLKDSDKVVSEERLKIIYETIKILKRHNHKIGIVIGGGNHFRGRENNNMEVITRDTIGMLGTVMNALHLKDYLFKNDVISHVYTPFNFPDLIPNLSDEELLNNCNKGEVIIFGGGVGKSGYSTDSGVILASEKLNGELIIKMTNVDGIYDSDPKVNMDANKYDKLTYNAVIENQLSVMDEYAFKKAEEMNIKILVMSFFDYEKLDNYFNGEKLGTEVK